MQFIHLFIYDYNIVFEYGMKHMIGHIYICRIFKEWISSFSGKNRFRNIYVNNRKILKYLNWFGNIFSLNLTHFSTNNFSYFKQHAFPS